MKTLFKLAALAALGVSFAGPAHAVQFQFTNEFSGSGGTCANTICATLDVVQNGANVDFVLTANLTGSEFITGLYGNIDPFQTIAASNIGGTTDETGVFALRAAANPGDTAFKADGDGFFDWRFDFSSAPPRLDGTETFTWTFANVDLADIINAISVNGPAGKTGFTFVLRVQGLSTGEGSGWFNSDGGDGEDGETELPEPGTLALFGIGLLGLGLLRRRRLS